MPALTHSDIERDVTTVLEMWIRFQRDVEKVASTVASKVGRQAPGKAEEFEPVFAVPGV